MKQHDWSYFVCFNRKVLDEENFNRIAEECVISQFHVIEISNVFKILYNPKERVSVRIYRKEVNK